jgi:hypothetical protein
MTKAVCMAVSNAGLILCSCGNDNNKTPAQTATETALPVRTEKSNQRPTVFNT